MDVAKLTITEVMEVMGQKPSLHNVPSKSEGIESTDKRTTLGRLTARASYQNFYDRYDLFDLDKGCRIASDLSWETCDQIINIVNAFLESGKAPSQVQTPLESESAPKETEIPNEQEMSALCKEAGLPNIEYQKAHWTPEIIEKERRRNRSLEPMEE